MEIMTNETVEAARTKIREVRATPLATGTLNIGDYLSHYNVPFTQKQNGVGTLYVLDACLFDPSHAKGEASIVQTADGKLLYQCFHESCKGHTWHEAREIISGKDSLSQFLPKHAQGQNLKAVEQPEQRKPLTFTPLADLFREPEEQIEWIVEGLLPMGGFSGLFGKPKGGKTTLARNLAMAVSTGSEFLKRNVSKGPVLYLALEEKRYEVRKHFRDMGADGSEEIHVFVSTAPIDALVQLRKAAEDIKPALIIIDPLFRLTRVKDGNDYVQVTAALEPLLSLARDTGSHVMIVHHTGKGEQRTSGDSILGSTAILGSVDTAIIVKRGDKSRSVHSIQRYGQDLEETTLSFDPSTRVITLGETKEIEKQKEVAALIVEFLSLQGEPVTEADILEGVEAGRGVKTKTLRALVEDRTILREGRGGKGDPFKYSCSVVPSIYMGTRKQENEIAREPLMDNKYSCSGAIGENGNFREQEKNPEDGVFVLEEPPFEINDKEGIVW